MVKRGDPQVLRLVVVSLRFQAGLTQIGFGKACRVDQATLSHYERGKRSPSEEVLRRMAEVARVPWPAVVHLRRVFGAILTATRRSDEALPGTAPVDGVLEESLLAVTPYLIEEAGSEPRGQKPELARRCADEIVARLLPLEPARRRRLVERTVRASRCWAVAETLGQASLILAAHDAAEALDLASLGLFVAERAPGTESWQAAMQANCWATLGNARRVGNDLDGAEAAISRFRQLFEASSQADRERLPEWGLLGHEASLRQEQQRFPEALALLERARVLAGSDDVAICTVLLKREIAYLRMGDAPAALASLNEAAPRIAAAGNARLRLAHRFNTAEVLSHLKRPAEADALLPEVRELAARLGNGLDSLRVLWLGGTIDASRGRRAEALRKLMQVQAGFTLRQLPFDAGLVSQDIARL